MHVHRDPHNGTRTATTPNAREESAAGTSAVRSRIDRSSAPAIGVQDHRIRVLVRWGLYPMLWTWLGVCMVYAWAHPEQLAQIVAVKGGVMMAVLLFVEWQYPLDDRWRMTRQHLLRRDVPLLVVNGVSYFVINTALLWLAIDLSQQWYGPMTGAPLWLQVALGLVVFELMQYSLHRLVHANRGPITRFLWRVHAIHHLPQQLYLVMHIVFHPINLLAVRLWVQLFPLWLLGFDPLAVFAYGAIAGLHGTVSHFNVDIRMGVLNYLFVGPELHRYHHSARHSEAVNFGAVLSVFDVLCGTFKYTPGQFPDTLGLSRDDGYPDQHQPLLALLFPFLPTRAARAGRLADDRDPRVLGASR